MNPTLCSRCKKNVAVIFITRLDNNGQGGQNEGLCLKCARELNIRPVTDMIEKMGLSDEDLEGLTTEMMSAFEGAESMEGLLGNLAGAMTDPSGDKDDDEDEGRTATFPFLNKLMGNLANPDNEKKEDALSETPPSSGDNPRAGREEKADRKNRNKRKFLDNHCISLTRKAAEGKLDRMIGRDQELERVIQILNRRQKNNPCLIGEPGVGKTAIAEGLAMRIYQGDVPYKLKGKEVYLLDLTSLVAGTQFRGQFESRMKGLIEEIKKFGNIILVIDEVHNLVGAGDAEGSMNAANILKPALSRGEIQVIGATTLVEYRKYIEKDSALERRFQPVVVNEPSIEDAVEIIKGVAPYYEQFHKVKITPDMARLAVMMSERYITDRFLPDKAIDLIDEACSDVNLRNKTLARTQEIQDELNDIEKEQELLADESSDRTYERLAALRSKELQLLQEQKELAEQEAPALTLDSLARVVELWTKIPASTIQEQEYERLAKLEDRLKQNIIGQDEAIAAVSSAIRRNRVGVTTKRKPVSFIFVGSTGVGKTELVKRLADDLFHSPESLIRLDMSEFMEKHSVSRIIGSPPGYVGYDEAGQLTEKIRRKPYSVILFDEIEKAHPDVLNILLQILDDGHITDAQGRTVNFENTVIVMTSNAGSESSSGPLGFGKTSNEQNKDKAMKALQQFLRPEFINRVDEVICFNQLSEENFRSIALIMLKELQQVLEEKHLVFLWDDSVLDHLVKHSYSATYGARNLRRYIQKHLEDPIATQIIESYLHPISALKAVVEDDKISILSL
ncbi:MAG: ATP-dependent Clp protease ATP-binding subunit [Evtepia sp.]|uniref:ATP-dependent Clp protease ATP-binding subunit n=1 Tax=Evtepia sp. TaxID=2773933 RepID=UPI002A76050A|nr:ATP-dependent Clp protease ATP-binding subunit [Evtepia sp.]MDY3014041.1 ATP-dependent Clp protease ATP-binding subunit [Evtepia sp.]